MTLPVSLLSPSARTPNENGTSAIAPLGMLHLTSRSSAILNPSEFRLRPLRNWRCVRGEKDGGAGGAHGEGAKKEGRWGG